MQEFSNLQLSSDGAASLSLSERTRRLTRLHVILRGAHPSRMSDNGTTKSEHTQRGRQESSNTNRRQVNLPRIHTTALKFNTIRRLLPP